jgi:cyclomaltodextrinase
MEEFIYGTVAVDDLKLVHHRLSQSGLQHAYEIRPRDPLPGEPVTLLVKVGPDSYFDRVACYYTLDGSEPSGSRGVAHNGKVLFLEQADTEWDSYVWGYVTHWQGSLPAQGEGVNVRYRIGAWRGDGEETFADWPDVKVTTDRATGAFFQGKELEVDPVGDPQLGTTFTWHVDRLLPPQWARESVIYHIFLDRFFPGKGRDWLQTSDLNGIFGGTLWGVAEKLEYIADLGATCIWLSPIFPSPSSHGYDATDFFGVASRFGGEEALRALVEGAHKLGIRVILDLVCNHVSNEHPKFVDAYKDPRSRYRNWFFFDDPLFGYRTFYGVLSMPQVNLSNDGAREWMFDVARFWLSEFDIDGFRLDHANGPGPGFWSDFWSVCKKEKPDSFCFGEVVEPAPYVCRYIGRMDGMLDFLFTDTLRRTFGRRAHSEEIFKRFLAIHLANFPEDFLMLTFIDNHDMDRFLFITGDQKETLMQVAAIQMQLPGPPVIYYGTEVGMSQKISKLSDSGIEASRMAMVWDERQDRELLEFYKTIIRQRKNTKPWTRKNLDLAGIL